MRVEGTLEFSGVPYFVVIQSKQDTHLLNITVPAPPLQWNNGAYM